MEMVFLRIISRKSRISSVKQLTSIIQHSLEVKYKGRLRISLTRRDSKIYIITDKHNQVNNNN